MLSSYIFSTGRHLENIQSKSILSKFGNESQKKKLVQATSLKSRTSGTQVVIFFMVSPWVEFFKVKRCLTFRMEFNFNVCLINCAFLMETVATGVFGLNTQALASTRRHTYPRTQSTPAGAAKLLNLQCHRTATS